MLAGYLIGSDVYCKPSREPQAVLFVVCCFVYCFVQCSEAWIRATVSLEAWIAAVWLHVMPSSYIICGQRWSTPHAQS